MGENIGQGWSKHMSRSQNKPYLFHQQKNKRYWTEEDLPKGWCWDWDQVTKLYRNVLTGITQRIRPSKILRVSSLVNSNNSNNEILSSTIQSYLATTNVYNNRGTVPQMNQNNRMQPNNIHTMGQQPPQHRQNRPQPGEAVVNKSQINNRRTAPVASQMMNHNNRMQPNVHMMRQQPPQHHQHQPPHPAHQQMMHSGMMMHPGMMAGRGHPRAPGLGKYSKRKSGMRMEYSKRKSGMRMEHCS